MSNEQIAKRHAYLMACDENQFKNMPRNWLTMDASVWREYVKANPPKMKHRDIPLEWYFE